MIASIYETGIDKSTEKWREKNGENNALGGERLGVFVVNKERTVQSALGK